MCKSKIKVGTMLIYLYSLTQLYPNAACLNPNQVMHRNSMLVIAISNS